MQLSRRDFLKLMSLIPGAAIFDRSKGATRLPGEVSDALEVPIISVPETSIVSVADERLVFDNVLSLDITLRKTPDYYASDVGTLLARTLSQEVEARARVGFITSSEHTQIMSMLDTSQPFELEFNLPKANGGKAGLCVEGKFYLQDLTWHRLDNKASVYDASFLSCGPISMREF